MLNAAFFTRLGFFVEPAFWSADECAMYRTAMDEALAEPAGVVSGGRVEVDQSRRRTRRAGVDGPLRVSLIERLVALRPQLEARFGVALGEPQEPQFLVYREGDFFRLHADTNYAAESPEFLRERRVSVIVFAGHLDAAEDEAGGTLVFHELLGDSRLAARGFPFPASEGMLVAFRADLLHEVTPVLRGTRYSVVTWFAGKGE